MRAMFAWIKKMCCIPLAVYLKQTFIKSFSNQQHTSPAYKALYMNYRDACDLLKLITDCFTCTSVNVICWVKCT